jgi:hypothetical protein
VRIEEHEYVGEYESGGIDRILRLAFSRRWPGVAFTLPEPDGTIEFDAGGNVVGMWAGGRLSRRGPSRGSVG